MSMAPVRQRKSHTKSRSGCAQCKARRIKCDETVPKCEHCAAKSLTCSLEFLSSAVHQISGCQAYSTERALAQNSAISTSVFAKPSLLPPTLGSPSLACYSRHDLELFHHFVSVTYFTVSQQSQQHKDCSNVIAQIACSNDFLMRNVLALSAAHLARLRPQEGSKLFSTAIQLQNTSLEPLRNELQNITRENCHAIFASCLILNCFMCAMLPQNLKASDAGSPVRPPNESFYTVHQSLVRWVHVLRGTMAVVEAAWPWLRDGPVAPFLSWPELQETENWDGQKRLDTGPICLADLEKCWTTNESKTHAEKVEANIYSEALEQLRTTFVCVANFQRQQSKLNLSPANLIDAPPGHPATIALTWPVRVSPKYISLLDQGRPEALCLLAYDAALLVDSSHNWWIEDVGRTAVLAINSLLQNEKDDTWRDLMLWPLSKCSKPEQ